MHIFSGRLIFINQWCILWPCIRCALWRVQTFALLRVIKWRWPIKKSLLISFCYGCFARKEVHYCLLIETFGFFHVAEDKDEAESGEDAHTDQDDSNRDLSGFEASECKGVDDVGELVACCCYWWSSVLHCFRNVNPYNWASSELESSQEKDP